MTDDPVTTTNPLDDEQRRRLTALLDTILPASADGRMPGAGELPFTAYLVEQARDYLEALPNILGRLDGAFAEWPSSERIGAVETLAREDPAAFDQLLMRIYDCYYQDDGVRRLIGADPGPPYPRGNVIPAGDLSSLEAVRQRSTGYRR